MQIPPRRPFFPAHVPAPAPARSADAAASGSSLHESDGTSECTASSLAVESLWMAPAHASAQAVPELFAELGALLKFTACESHAYERMRDILERISGQRVPANSSQELLAHSLSYLQQTRAGGGATSRLATSVLSGYVDKLLSMGDVRSVQALLHSGLRSEELVGFLSLPTLLKSINDDVYAAPGLGEASLALLGCLLRYADGPSVDVPRTQWCAAVDKAISYLSLGQRRAVLSELLNKENLRPLAMTLVTGLIDQTYEGGMA